MKISEAIEAIKQKYKKNPNGWLTAENVELQKKALLLYFFSLDFLEGKNEIETLKKCGAAFRNITVVHLLFDEINNGGLMQYYTNSSGQQFIFTEQALKEMDMKDMLAVMSKTNPIMEKALERAKGSFDDLDFTNSEAATISKFDDEFYELDSDSEQYDLLDEYLERHLNDLI